MSRINFRNTSRIVSPRFPVSRPKMGAHRASQNHAAYALPRPTGTLAGSFCSGPNPDIWAAIAYMQIGADVAPAQTKAKPSTFHPHGFGNDLRAQEKSK